MKIVLSRKGFDSSSGGYPSPILPDGKMLSLPIPGDWETLTYSDIIAPGGKTYAEILEELDAGLKLSVKRFIWIRILCQGYEDVIQNGCRHLDKTVPRSRIWKTKGFRAEIYFCFSAGSAIPKRSMENYAFTATITASTPYSVTCRLVISSVPAEPLNCQSG